MDRIEIPLSKSKILLLLIGSIGFLIAGILFFKNPATFISPIIRNPEIIRFIGIAAILFFGGVGIYGATKLFDKTIGLIIDENGITDNTNASSIGLIEWTDIVNIESAQVMSTKFILIFTTNPDKYLNRVKGFKRKLMQGNINMYGTPLAITSSTINYNFDELENLMISKLAEYQKNISNRELLKTEN